MAESKKFLLFVLTIVWTTSITESTLSDCKKPLVSIGTGCYNFQNLSLSFEQYSDAVKACPPDSHPVDIGSEEELEILSRAVKARLSSRTPFNGIWTSGSRTSNVENYYWDTSTLAEQKKEVDYFAWLNNDTPLEKRNNSLALAFNTATGLLGYIDVNPDYYPTGLGLVCKGIVCPPPICQYDTNCVPFVDPNGCTICSQCGGKRCKVQVDVEADGVAICTTCYCKRECDDVKKCLYGCHLVAREGGCPKCECPAAVVPVDVQLKFTKIVPNAGDMICLTVNKLIGVSEICTKKIVLRCRPTAILEDGYGHATVTVAVVTLSVKTSYPDFISVLNECKYFLENNLLRKIGSHTVENVLIEVPNYMPTPPPVTQSTCMKEKGNLPCDDTNKFYELRWEFNTRIGYCRPYVHNGCQSDIENSFRTLLECSTSCSKAHCFLPRNPDCCEVYNERWTYNPYTGICEPFKACEYGGNSNSFRTEDECYLACPREVCGEPVDVGPCRSMSVVPQYHYDIVTNECNIFNWGGCFGNGNKFRLCESCEEKCKAIPMNLELGTTTLGKATSAVKTTADPQNLSTMHHINRGNITFFLYKIHQIYHSSADASRHSKCLCHNAYILREARKLPTNKYMARLAFLTLPDV